MRHRLVLALVIALTCKGAAAAAPPGSDGTLTITLQAAPRNAGEVGKAFMTAQGDETAIMLTLTGVPSWVVRPVQLYTFVYAGSCAAHDSTPAYALNDVVQAGLFSRGGASGPFTLRKMLPMSMRALRAGAYALVVRTGPADGNVDIFCGDMK